MAVATGTFIWSLSTPPKFSPEGIEWNHIPFIETTAVPDALTIAMLAEARSIVVTSRKAIDALRPFAADYSSLPIMAVGPASTHDLTALGFANVIMPTQYTARGVVEYLADHPLPEPILFPHGNRGGATVLEYLHKFGIKHTAPVIYTTRARSVGDLGNDLKNLTDVKVVVLGSPSAVSAWARISTTIKPAPKIATIGPTTTSACRDAEIPVWIEGAGEATNLNHLIAERYESTR